MAPPLRIRPKLRVGDRDDPLEREADAVADRVMRMADSPPGIRRACADCEQDQVARPKSATAAPVAPATMTDILRSDGEPLAPATRAFFEPRFGADLSDIRVHTDSRAAESARGIGARAYAAGNHIAFAAGEFAPHQPDGRRLLAHELTHTLQNRTMPHQPPTLRREEVPPPGSGSLQDRAKLQASKDIITATQTTVPDAAGGVGDFPKAFAILDGLQKMSDMLATLDELKTLGPFALLLDHFAEAVGVDRPRIDVAMSAVRDHGRITVDQFKTAHADALAGLPADQQTQIQDFLAKPAATAPAGTTAALQGCAKPVPQMDSGEKLSCALEFARSERDASWNQAIDGLKSPQSIATIVFVGLAFIAAQSVPVTWIADAALLAGLAIVGFFTGMSVATFFLDLGKFFLAINAQNEDDLHASGKALADAVALFGVFAITGALTEGIGAGLKGIPRAPGGPPPAGFTDAYATSVGRVRVPDELVPADGPALPSNSKTTGSGKPVPAKPATPPTDPATGTEPPAGTPTETPAPTEAPPAGMPGYRSEPTLRNAGWGPRPEGGASGEAYAQQITGSKESLYVWGLKDELGGTGFVEIEGYRPADRILVDAKDATAKGFYDLSGALKTPPDSFTMNFKVPKVLLEAARQTRAAAKSGAAGVEWHVSNQPVAALFQRLFDAQGIRIKVIFTPKT